MIVASALKSRVVSIAALVLAFAIATPNEAFAAKKRGAKGKKAAASAPAGNKRVGVAKFNGPQEALIRKRVTDALGFYGYTVVNSREIDSAARSLGVTLDSNESFNTLAKELSLSSIVTGDVGKKKAKLTVHNGNDGASIGEASFTGANSAKIATDVTKTMWRKLGGAFGRGKAPAGARAPSQAPVAEEKEEAAPEEKAAPVAETKEEEEAEEAEVAESEEERPKKKRRTDADVADDAEATGPLPVALDVQAGGRFFSRKLDYNQDYRANLREYQLKMASALGAAAVWYPLAHGSSGFLSNIGVDASIEQAFGITSKLGGTNNFPTTIHDYAVGVRFRLPLGASSVGFMAQFGEHAYKLASAAGADRTMLDLPDTIYRYTRLGTQVRVPLGSRLAVMGGGAYRIVMSPGQIKSTPYFPHATVGGVDLNVAVGYRVTSSIEARVGYDLRRYFYAMNSKLDDMRVAGGAIDQYHAFTVSLAFMLGGDGGDAADSAETVAKRSDDDDQAADSDADGDGDADADARKKANDRG